MSKETIILVTLGLFLAGNLLGAVYSWAVLYTDVFKKFRLQTVKYKPGIFFQRLPLVVFNVSVLSVITAFSLWYVADMGLFDTTVPTWWLALAEVVAIFVIDDAWFYFIHRRMHENKFLMRKIHNIHHRAITPFPLEYIYVHPLEWFAGSLGSFLGLLAIILIMPGHEVNVYAFWIYGALKNLHEIDIHSDVRSFVSNKFPFLFATEQHDLHHSKVKGNYASMFNLWDKVFGTTLK